MEETTTQEIMEQETQEQTETPTQEQQTQEEQQLNSDPVVYDSLPDNSENIIHELFAEIGVNLDYTPQNVYQCFTMSLQFIAALWFIWWLVKYVFTLLRNFLSPRGWL